MKMNHITLAVNDINRSFEFYCNILGLKPLCKWDQGAYFLAGDLWFCLNVDDNVKPEPSYTHYAFSVTTENFKAMCERIIATGAGIFKANTSPGDSLYFLDPDGHKLEIHVGDWRARIREKKQSTDDWKNVKWYVY
jgi:catechol 2,3-dioxygenase-like lactoylglutathione lyase family enzyme